MADINATTRRKDDDVAASLSRRAASLGIPLWYAKPNGEICRRPAEPGDLAAWLASPPFEQLIRDAIVHAAAASSPKPFELYPGCWALPLAVGNVSRRSGVYLATLWFRDGLHGDDFDRLSAGAHLEPATVANQLEPLARTRIEEVHQLWSVLRWTLDDLLKAADDGAAVAQLSERLSQSYEEAELLFRLTRLMNSSTDLSQLITIVCDQLHQVLPFGWVAVRFGEQGVAISDLAGRLQVAGNLSVSRERFESMVAAITRSWKSDDYGKLLEPGRHELADATGAAVIAEPISHDDKVIGVLLAGNKRGPDPDLTSGEMRFIDAAADFLGIFHENISRFAEQRATFIGTLKALTAAIDAKDPYTRGHSERAALLAGQLAARMNLPPEEVQRFRLGGLVHDVGKIGVPEVILAKKEPLNEAEFEQIKRHPEIGYRILKDIPSLACVLQGVLHHHERWDGGGYPFGMAGEQIPLLARVIALADAFDAMSSSRAYRPLMPRDKVLAEIRGNSGTQFDPTLVPLFLTLDFAPFDQLLARDQAASALAA